ncbi:hypothetical protein GGS24DRAFT_485486 [Hypoxylon argillaceum]|nr:hypothetical protein GGS24DRAFT_485486 [Hypoxylon argillaceum]
MSKGSKIPIGLWRKYTDPKYWFDDLSEQLDTCTVHYTTYFARCISDYICMECTGYVIVRVFSCDFVNWSYDQFNQVNRRFRREMIELIEVDGTYGRLPGTSYTDKLVQLHIASQDS